MVAVQKIQLNKLSLDRVLLNPQYVYINDVTKEMQFLYIPSDKPIQTLGVTGFFDAIIYAAIPSHEDDMEYVARTNDRIKSMKEFSAEKLELFIQKEDREIVNIIRKQHSGQSGVMDTARTIHNRPGPCGFWLLVYDETGDMLYAGRYDSSLTPTYHKQSCSLAHEYAFEPQWKEK